MNLLMSNLQFTKKTALTPLHLLLKMARKKKKRILFWFTEPCVCILHICKKALFNSLYQWWEFIAIAIAFRSAWVEILEDFFSCITINFSQFLCFRSWIIFMRALRKFIFEFSSMNSWCGLGMKGKKINEIFMKLWKLHFLYQISNIKI